MASLRFNYSCTSELAPFKPLACTQFSGDRQKAPLPAQPRPPAEDFSPLAAIFRRRLIAGVGSASLVAVGANFAGVTSLLLGFSPDTGRNLKLDVLYPINGYSRCLQTSDGFEFVYPANWVGDQRLLYREARKAELERSLDLPPLNDTQVIRRPYPARNFTEPVVAFGPPRSNGELNVSVIVSPVPLDFSIEAFGGPKEVGGAILRKIAGSGRRSDIVATLIDSRVREDRSKKIHYYKLEFEVESPAFHRHNVAVCVAGGGRLFTLNAQAPESAWPRVSKDFNIMADSFTVNL